MAKAHAEVSIYYGSYYDMTPDIISDVVITRGFVDQRPTTRVASPGKATFTLRNDAGAYNGEDAYTRTAAGWVSWFVRGAHVIIEFVATVETETTVVTKFEGWIEKIEIDYKDKTVDVTCYDWLYYAGLKLFAADALAVQADVDVLDAIGQVKNAITPDGGTVWGNGTNDSLDLYWHDFANMELVFNDLDYNKQVAYELTKLVLSEFGFMYIGRKHTVELNANAIIVESRGYRDGRDRTLTQAPLPTGLCDNFIFESGDNFILEDGNNLVFDSQEVSELVSEYQTAKITDGNLIFNRFITRNSAIIEPLGPGILWSNTVVPYIAPTKTYGVYAIYSDEYNVANGAFCLPANTITPIATTDYTANTLADGTGVDKTADVSVDSITKYLNLSIIVMKNNGASGVYLTKLQIRGDPVILAFYGTIETWEAIPSQDDYGLLQIDFTKYYVSDYFMDDPARQMWLYYVTPRVLVESVEFIANTSNHTMILALMLDVGSQIRINDTKSGVNDIYYIDKVDYTIRTNGIVTVKWTLRENFVMEIY